MAAEPDATVLAFPTAPDAADDEIDDDEMTATDIDDLFARLRADRPEDAEPTDEAPDEDAAEPSRAARRRSGAATPPSCR